MIVNILGTDYTITFKTKLEDKYLEKADGYTDFTSKKIVVISENNELDNFSVYQKQCLRHEIVHGFMFESGLYTDWQHITFGQEETTVDWIALQFPKLLKAFEEVGAM